MMDSYIFGFLLSKNNVNLFITSGPILFFYSDSVYMQTPTENMITGWYNDDIEFQILAFTKKNVNQLFA